MSAERTPPRLALAGSCGAPGGWDDGGACPIRRRIRRLSTTAQPTARLGFPLCRLVGLVCLGSGAVLDAAIGRCRGKGGDEQTLLRSMLDTLDARGHPVGRCVLRHLFSALRACGERGVDGVFEQHGSRRRSTDFRRGQRLGARDHLIVLHKPEVKPDWMSQADYEQAPESLKVRELRTGGKILVTTLLCPKHTAQSRPEGALSQTAGTWSWICATSRPRWAWRRLSCQTPAMAIKEIWVYLLAYNLIRLMMAQAALLADMPAAPAQLQAHRADLDRLESDSRTGSDDDNSAWPVCPDRTTASR